MSVLIKIGTRGSKLALWQAYHIESLLKEAGADVEIITIETKGDKILDKALSKIGSKGVFTEELEQALYDGKIDIAVHSAKDLPSSMDERLSLIAFTERETANDVLVSNTKVEIDKPLVIGTSSTRRVALLKHYYPEYTIVDMRGNLQTRFRKMNQGDCDAMLLAFAGVHRMELDDSIKHIFPANKFTPPVGQGSVAIQVAHEMLSDSKKKIVRNSCNHEKTESVLLAERAFLRKLEGGCSIPVFGHGIIENGTIFLSVGIISLDGQEILRVEQEGLIENPIELGERAAQELLSLGGDKILKEIKEML